jgi:hypothetical protein
MRADYFVQLLDVGVHQHAICIATKVYQFGDVSFDSAGFAEGATWRRAGPTLDAAAADFVPQRVLIFVEFRLGNHGYAP